MKQSSSFYSLLLSKSTADDKSEQGELYSVISTVVREKVEKEGSEEHSSRIQTYMEQFIKIW